MNPEVRIAPAELRPDLARVAWYPFLPGASTPGGTSRTDRVLDRLRSIAAGETAAEAELIRERFADRHEDFEPGMQANAARADPGADRLDPTVRFVTGAVFAAESAVDGAALCNPSAVVHPDQSGLPVGVVRVLLSLRSIGEGHISSISFAEALVGPGREWTFEARQVPVVTAGTAPMPWDSGHLRRVLEHHGGVSEAASAVLHRLPPQPTSADVDEAIAALPGDHLGQDRSLAQFDVVRTVARSAYRAEFPADTEVSQRVLVPGAEEERHGIEDARFVRFTDRAGAVDYRATFTAYDGRSIGSRSIRTRDFREFDIERLSGTPSRTKGMAFFPRPVGGRHLALSRTDGESILLAASEDGLHWTDEAVVAVPERLWEIVQLGNCGSPIETEAGWLVLTHGVGPMRRYSIGALLLDLDDPSRLIARSTSPILEPEGAQRDGYVPNVVYSCGGLVIEGMLWIPYGVADARIRVASIPLDRVFEAFESDAAEPASPQRVPTAM